MTTLFHKTKTLADALCRCDEVNRKWRAKVMGCVGPLLTKLPPGDARALRSLLGIRAYAGPILASDLGARRKLGRISARVVDAYAGALSLRWFHVTLLTDDAQTSERKPQLLLKRLKGKTYKTLQELGLDAVYWIDVDPLPNHPRGGEGGSFLFHVHAVAFANASFNLQEARRKLNASRSWSCRLGAKPATIVEITPGKGTPGWWAQYASKPPYRAKSERVDGQGKVELRWTDRGYRPHLALRLTEGFSQMALLDLCGGVGEGKELREEIRKRLTKWHRRRWPDQKRRALSFVPRLFRVLWPTRRVKNYQPWQILGSTV